eukprot:3385781-Rhodomonas_salina.1
MVEITLLSADITTCQVPFPQRAQVSGSPMRLSHPQQAYARAACKIVAVVVVVVHHCAGACRTAAV